MRGCELASPLRGIVPPMATPLLDRDTLDREGLERLVEHILAAGVSGLFILGSTGEAPGLTHQLRRKLVGRVCAQVRRRIPVLVGITDTCLDDSLELARAAEAAGAAAVVAAPPYYFQMDQAELLGYVRRLAAELPLPLLLYNMPALTKVSIEPDTLACAAEIPGVVGFKDSSENMDYFKRVVRLLRAKDGFSLLTGSERLLSESLASGAHGGVCGGANIWPSLLVNLHRAATSADHTETARLQGKLDELSAVYRVGKSDASYLCGLKSALACLGLCSAVLAEPYQSFGSAEHARVREVLAQLDLV